MHGNPIPPGGRTQKEERKEETGGEERAPTAVTPMKKVRSPNNNEFPLHFFHSPTLSWHVSLCPLK